SRPRLTDELHLWEYHTRLAFSADGTHLAAVGGFIAGDGRRHGACLWDTRTGAVITEGNWPQAMPSEVLDKEGAHWEGVFVVAPDQTDGDHFSILDPVTGKPRCELFFKSWDNHLRAGSPNGTRYVFTGAADLHSSPDGKTVASEQYDPNATPIIWKWI